MNEAYYLNYRIVGGSAQALSFATSDSTAIIFEHQDSIVSLNVRCYHCYWFIINAVYIGLNNKL